MQFLEAVNDLRSDISYLSDQFKWAIGELTKISIRLEALADDADAAMTAKDEKIEELEAELSELRCGGVA